MLEKITLLISLINLGLLLFNRSSDLKLSLRAEIKKLFNKSLELWADISCEGLEGYVYRRREEIKKANQSIAELRRPIWEIERDAKLILSKKDYHLFKEKVCNSFEYMFKALEKDRISKGFKHSEEYISIFPEELEEVCKLLDKIHDVLENLQQKYLSHNNFNLLYKIQSVYLSIKNILKTE